MNIYNIKLNVKTVNFYKEMYKKYDFYKYSVFVVHV
jgi:hypothetical protein